MPTAIQLGIDDVLGVVTQTYGMEGTQRGDEFDVLCPNPAHPERDPSCSVNLHTGLWKCLACGTAGDLIILGTYVLQEPYAYVEELLKPNTVESLLSSVQRKLSHAMAKTPRLKQPKLPGPYDDGPLDELTLDRGLRLHILKKWGVRYCRVQKMTGKKGDFILHNSIAIPIRDDSGRLLAWCYRRTNQSPGWQPRYMYTPEAQLSELWFGLQHHSSVDDIVIVEGAVDAMWLDQQGFPALALLGSEMGERKLQYLTRYKTVTLFGDYDNAGIHSVKRIGQAIGSRVAVKVARYSSRSVSLVRSVSPKAKIDPAVLPPLDLELAIHTAIPWTTWLQRHSG